MLGAAFAALAGDTTRTPHTRQRRLLQAAQSCLLEGLLQHKLSEALETLSERERNIVKARYLGDKSESLRALGERLGLSGERVRQLEKRAMKKLREALGPEMSMELVAA